MLQTCAWQSYGVSILSVRDPARARDSAHARYLAIQPVIQLLLVEAEA